MQGNSSPVISNQAGVHERLEEVVRKHASSEFKRPIAGHALQAWELFQQGWDGQQEIVLDSGCGTAQSTGLLAQQYSDCLVVGVDRSLARLEKTQSSAENSLLLRTNLEDFWRLLALHGVKLKAHYLLYPNPYPKASRFRYRWHGSPVFPTLLELSELLVLRSNWPLYLTEFEAAVKLLKPKAVSTGLQVLPWQDIPLTAFEDKYQRSQQTVYGLQVSF